MPDLLDLAEVYCSREELAVLRGLNGAERSKAFLRFWTLKEAYLKARGLGLSRPLSQLSFQLDGEEVRADFGTEIVDSPRHWTFISRWLGSGHVLALAFRAASSWQSTCLIRATVPLAADAVTFRA